MLNIKQFTYEIFDGFASNVAGSYESIKSKSKQDAELIQPENAGELPPPAAPVFSADEVETAKNLAREEGIQQGYAQAKKQFEEHQAANDTKLEHVIVTLATEIERISKQIESRRNLLTNEFAELAVSLAKQICKNLPEEVIVKQAEGLISEALANLDKTQKIKITLNPKNAAGLNGKFTGVEINTSEEIQIGDFKVEWQNGYLEHDTAKLWENMQQLIAKHFTKAEIQKIETQKIETQITETKNNEQGE